jgi:hypothetical protein
MLALCLCALIWVASLPVTMAANVGPDSPLLGGNFDHLSDRIPGTSARRVGEIARGTVVTQEFPAPAGKIAALGLLLSTYGRTNQGVLQVTLDTNTSGTWERLAARQVPKQTLQDTQIYTVNLSPPLDVAIGQMLRISLQTDDDASQAVSWWADPDWQPAGYTLRVNGAQTPGTGIFTVTTYRTYDHLFRAAGPLWSRATVFLSASWRFVLAVAGCAGAIGLVFAVAQIFRPGANAGRATAEHGTTGDDPP